MIKLKSLQDKGTYRLSPEADIFSSILELLKQE